MSTVLWRPGNLVDANALLSAHHYLGPIRRGLLVVVGETAGQIVAAQVWNLPTSRRLPLDGTWLELSRWCLTPAAGEYAGSRQHAAAVRLIRATVPETTTLVSYSDPSAGHTGALYRACNWQWWPTWHRLRPPPTGQGEWSPGKRQAVKDRWVFPLRPDPERPSYLRVNDAGAIRRWLASRPAVEIRWAAHHPELSAGVPRRGA